MLGLFLGGGCCVLRCGSFWTLQAVLALSLGSLKPHRLHQDTCASSCFLDMLGRSPSWLYPAGAQALIVGELAGLQALWAWAVHGPGCQSSLAPSPALAYFGRTGQSRAAALQVVHALQGRAPPASSKARPFCAEWPLVYE